MRTNNNVDEYTLTIKDNPYSEEISDEVTTKHLFITKKGAEIQFEIEPLGEFDGESWSIPIYSVRCYQLVDQKENSLFSKLRAVIHGLKNKNILFASEDESCPNDIVINAGVSLDITPNTPEYKQAFATFIFSIAECIALSDNNLAKILNFFQLEDFPYFQYVTLNMHLQKNNHKEALSLANTIAKTDNFDINLDYIWKLIQSFQKVCETNPTENIAAITAAQIKICNAIINDKNHTHYETASSFLIDHLEKLLSYQKDNFIELSKEEIEHYSQKRLELLFHSKNPKNKTQLDYRFSELSSFPYGTGPSIADCNDLKTFLKIADEFKGLHNQIKELKKENQKLQKTLDNQDLPKTNDKKRKRSSSNDKAPSEAPTKSQKTQNTATPHNLFKGPGKPDDNSQEFVHKKTMK